MLASVLLIEVALLNDRWHGAGDWPPSPFRLFQALVAGAYGGRWVAEDPAERDAAFRWLERQASPRIAAPPRGQARPITSFVPNNDLDAVGGDPQRVAEIRAAKISAPAILEQGTSFLYAWAFDGDTARAHHLCALADRLHTFGRGIDAAFARGEVVGADEAEERLLAHGGTVSRPTGIGDRTTPCPTEGSLDSLKLRHRRSTVRFETQRNGRKTETLFRQPPKAQMRPVAYESPPTLRLYELRRPTDPCRFYPAPQEQARLLVETIRDAAAGRLMQKMPDRAAQVERFLVGRGVQAADTARRVRIIPLPSIGVPHTSPSIRRLAVEIPPDCPIPVRDLEWAFAGLSYDIGEIPVAVLTSTKDGRMTRHYGFGESGRPARRWRSVTPVALPSAPGRIRTGGERVDAETVAADSVAAAVRHAGVTMRATDLRIQREPFHRRGIMADAFGADTRFAGRLRHIEIMFDRPIQGPLVVGDGRFVGLGVMYPVMEPPPGLHLFALAPESAPSVDQASALTHALRRAVMARAQSAVGERTALPPFFSGHEDDGRPLRSGKHVHLFFLADDADGDGRLDRLAVIAPHLVDRTASISHQRLRELDRALTGLAILRAGRMGAPRLEPLAGPPDEDRVFGCGRVWISRTPYRPTRHPHRNADRTAALCADVLEECTRRGLPRPEVVILAQSTGPRGGIELTVRLRFAASVQGPLLLGNGSHLGGGLFAIEQR